MPDFQVTGAESLARASRALKAQGTAGKGVRKEMLRTIQKTAKPLRGEVKQSAEQNLPKRGGLNMVVAGSRFFIRTYTAGSNPRVTLGAKGRTLENIRRTDRGSIRHPVFADRSKPRESWRWLPKNKPQKIRPGWWSKPLEKAGPAIRRDLAQALDQIARDVARRSHR